MVEGVGGCAVDELCQAHPPYSSKHGYFWVQKNQDGSGQNAKLEASEWQVTNNLVTSLWVVTWGLFLELMNCNKTINYEQPYLLPV